jgi:energy-coupling factor transporter ATP-binding protein EcfA2
MSNPQGQNSPFNVDEFVKKIQEILVGWGAPGVGVGFTLHYALTFQWTQAILALVGTALITLLIKIFTKLDPRFDALAEWLVSGMERSLLRFISRFQFKYTQSLIYTLRDYRVQGLKTKGPFVLDLQKVFVPLRIAPESVNKATSAMIQSRDLDKSLEIWDVLAAISAQPAFQRLVVLGPPGSGKSTLLEHLTLTYAQNTQRKHYPRAPRKIPILLYLRQVAGAICQEQSPTLAILIEQQEAIRALNPPPQWFETRLQQGHCLVMLDGLDEVADTQQRKQVSQWVSQQMQLYPKSCFILTSRPFGYKTAPLEPVTTLEVLPFNLKQMQAFVRNWYLQNEIMSRLGRDDPGVRATATRQAEDLIRRIKGNAALAAMALNPLLLTMIATIHCYRGALPGRRVELYAEICDVLLGRRQEAKGLPADKLTAAQKQTVLQVLALNRMRKKTREFTLLQAGLLIQEKLVAVAGKDLYPEEFLHQVENVSGLLVEKQPGIYEFAHKSFQEYLAAVQVKDSNLELLLARNIDDPWWEETIRLYAAQTDASNLIWAALQKANVAALTLAYECLAEGLLVQRDVRKELEDTLERGLRSSDLEIFRLAAEVRLSRRLRQLVRMDETTEIDPDYITCAEYQLFIDDKRKEGENCQPDHWTTERFAPVDATKPITGVRASDAIAFCEWLTQWAGNLGDTYLEGDAPIFVGEFRFRLPKAVEVQENPNPEAQIGCWCRESEQSVIAGIDQSQLETWKTVLVKQLERVLESDRTRARGLDRTRILDRARVLAHTPNLDHALDHAYAFDRVLHLGHVRAFELTLDIALYLDSALYRIIDLDGALELGFDRAIDFELALQRAIDIDSSLSLDHTCSRNLPTFPSLDLQEIRAYLLVLLALWHVFADDYSQIAKNRKTLQRLKKTRRECETISQECLTRRDETLNLYAFFVLLDERRAGRMPVWEGIRVVRERATDG